MSEFWEEKFKSEKIAWGLEPSDSAILARDLFLKQKCKNILIPGIGYGRNAKIFHDSGMKVTGIEISKSAIDLAHKLISSDVNIYCGSVTEMPFDSVEYDGIFSYALVHLLNKIERGVFISNCYNQLRPEGYMIFTVISKKSGMYGNGKILSKDRYKLANSLSVYFYDKESIEREYSDYGLMSFDEIDEPIKFTENEPALKCYLIKCFKKDNIRVS